MSSGSTIITSPSSSDAAKKNVGAIVGGVLGGIAGLLLLAGLGAGGYYLYRKWYSSPGHFSSGESAVRLGGTGDGDGTSKWGSEEFF